MRIPSFLDDSVAGILAQLSDVRSRYTYVECHPERFFYPHPAGGAVCGTAWACYVHIGDSSYRLSWKLMGPVSAC
jgi:hypothetical protein